MILKNIKYASYILNIDNLLFLSLKILMFKAGSIIISISVLSNFNEMVEV